MVASLFDLFKIGIGPSSSHTMGPMTAGARFVEALVDNGMLVDVVRVETRLFGSLALTGKGHATDRAVLLGLVSYGTYDLTNLATLKDWPVLITVVDLIWGTFVTATTSGITFYLAKLLK